MTDLLLETLELAYTKRPEVQRLGFYYEAFILFTEELKQTFGVQANSDQKPRFIDLLHDYEKAINNAINKHGNGYAHIYNRVKKWLLKILRQSAVYYYLDEGFVSVVKRRLGERIKQTPEYRFAKGWRDVIETIGYMNGDEQAITKYAQRVIELADRTGYIKMFGTKEALEVILNFYTMTNEDNNKNIQ